MGIEFKFFEAKGGDSILVSTEQTHILIDGGFGETYKDEITPKIKLLDKLDLVVLTHTDKDHICGLIEMLNNKKHKKDRAKINHLWFNSTKGIRVRKTGLTKVSDGNGILFQELIEEHKISYSNNIFLDNDKYKKSYIFNDIKLHLLSPFEDDLQKLEKKEIETEARFCNGRVRKISNDDTQIEKDTHLDDIDISETKFGIDNTLPNNSSIAFIMEYKSKKFLFLADANIDTINRSLKNMGFSKNNRLEIDFVKISHHGSRNNINSEFLDIVKAKRFVILTDGQNETNNHPNKDIFSLILNHEKREKYIIFILNYKEVIEKKFYTDEFKKYSFKALHSGSLRFNKYV